MDYGGIDAQTAAKVLRTLATGEPFVFEAQEGDFLIFRTSDGLGITEWRGGSNTPPCSDSTGLQDENGE